MFTMKLLVLSVLVAQVYYIVRTALLGRHMSLFGRTAAMVSDHKGYTSGVLCTTLIALVLLEFVVHAPELHAKPVWMPLLYGHLVFAGSFLVSFLLLKFWFTGERAPKTHRWMTWVTVGLLAVVLPTGLVMLYKI